MAERPIPPRPTENDSVQVSNPLPQNTQVQTASEQPIVKPVNVSPRVVLEKEEKNMVTILIDREMTSGGIRINGKLYVGNVTVTQEQADDLLRIQEEHFETKKKLLDPNINVRMKNDLQKEALFLADPGQNQGKSNFTRDYGLLGAKEWSYCSLKFKEHLLQLRKQLYGY